MDLSRPKLLTKEMLYAARWAMWVGNVQSVKYDRALRTWTVQTYRGYFSETGFFRAVVNAYRARWKPVEKF